MCAITTDQLNEVAGLLGTRDRTVVFSAVLKTLTDGGVPVDAAFDMLFGLGAYERFAGQVFDALQVLA
jgi:hypothetical protein